MIVLVALILVLVGGLALSSAASGRALEAAESLGERAGLSPFVIGLTIVSIGTDLPEIANSISAAASGHGDLNVGDSTGSAAVQITFVLGVLCIMRPLPTPRRFVATAGLFTVGALILGAVLMADGHIGRLDGLLLILVWAVATPTVGRSSPLDRTSQPTLFGRGAVTQLGRTLIALAFVGAGAVAAVTAFIEITDRLGVPEYVTSFFVLSVGTSLPELFVNGRAMLQGSGRLALGALLGASLVDATLSLGIGPALFPTDVSDEAAAGTIVVAGVVGVAVAVLFSRSTHHRPSGVALLGLYVALFPLLLLLA